MRHKCVTAGFMTELDQPGEFTIDFTITIDTVVTTHQFVGGGTCRNHWPCDIGRKSEWYT